MYDMPFIPSKEDIEKMDAHEPETPSKVASPVTSPVTLLRKEMERLKDEIRRLEDERYRISDQINDKLAESQRIEKAVEVLEGHAEQTMEKGECPKCGGVVGIEDIAVRDKNGNERIKRQCARGHFITWVAKDIPLEEYVMPYGKYAGVKITEVPKEYLSWLYREQNPKGKLKEMILKRFCFEV